MGNQHNKMLKKITLILLLKLKVKVRYLQDLNKVNYVS